MDSECGTAGATASATTKDDVDSAKEDVELEKHFRHEEKERREKNKEKETDQRSQPRTTWMPTADDADYDDARKIVLGTHYDGGDEEHVSINMVFMKKCVYELVFKILHLNGGRVNLK